MNFSDIKKIPFFKNHIFEHVIETGSTNDNIKAKIKKSDFIHCLQLADFQTAGRGQYNRKWVSEKSGESLMFSFSAELPCDSFPASLIGGIAMSGALRGLSVNCKNLWLKWPNDLWYKNGKLGGILTESSIIDGKILCVIGIGINISAINDKSLNTSCVNEFAPEITKEILLKAFCEEWDKIIYYDSVALSKLWRDYGGIFWQNVFMVIVGNEEKFTAKPTAINSDGSLNVTSDSTTRRLVSASLQPILPCSLDAS